MGSTLSQLGASPMGIAGRVAGRLVVAFVGAPGAGKSKLVNDLLVHCGKQPAAVCGCIYSRHTLTTKNELFEASEQLVLIDTPGFGSGELPWSVEPDGSPHFMAYRASDGHLVDLRADCIVFCRDLGNTTNLYALERVARACPVETRLVVALTFADRDNFPASEGSMEAWRARLTQAMTAAAAREAPLVEFTTSAAELARVLAVAPQAANISPPSP